VEDAVEHARAWYASRGLPLRLQLPLQARSLLDGELGERGFDAVQPDTHVLAARLDMLPADPPTVDRLDLADAPDDEWLALYGGHPAARALLTRHDQAGFARVVRDGETVAIARGAVDGDWLGIFALRVREDQQRRGLGTALLHRLWAWGRERGARRTYAQVFGGNEPGLTFFTAAGYWHHHDYRYRYPAAG
jgi:GNAT superfamily N-acetyltransferase